MKRNEAREKYLKNKLEEVLASNIRVSGTFSIVLAVLVIGVSSSHGELDEIHYFLAALLIASLIIRTWWGFQKSENWHWIFSILNIFVSVGWAGTLIKTFLEGEKNHDVINFTTLVAAGLVGTAPHSLALSKRDYYIFTSAVIFSLVVNYLNYDFGSLYSTSGLVAILLLAIFLIRQRNQQEFSWRSLQGFNFDLQGMIESLPVGVAVIKNGIVKNSNSVFSQIFLNSKQNLQVRDAFNKLVDLSKQSDEFQLQWEVQLPINEKEMGVFLALAVNKEGVGGIETIVSIMSIKDVRTLEKEVQKQKMQIENSSKMAALGIMSSGLAHEINNPLATISGRVQLMNMVVKQIEQNLDKTQFEKLNKSIDVIQNTVFRISKIIKGLRNFARETDGDPFEDINLKEVIDTTLSFCESRLVSRGIEIETQVEGELIFSGRSAEISQVLLNALNNSCDAVESKQEKWIKLFASQMYDKIIIKIQDSGSGIHPEHRDKIMVPFFTTKEVGKGTGLGLSLSRGIIETHGGKIFFNYSSPCTELVIELPIAKMDIKADQKSAS